MNRALYWILSTAIVIGSFLFFIAFIPIFMSDRFRFYPIFVGSIIVGIGLGILGLAALNPKLLRKTFLIGTRPSGLSSLDRNLMFGLGTTFTLSGAAYLIFPRPAMLIVPFGLFVLGLKIFVPRSK